MNFCWRFCFVYGLLSSLSLSLSHNITLFCGFSFFQVSCDSGWEMVWRTLIGINDEMQLNSNRILKSNEDPFFFSFETETALKELYLDFLYPFECFKQGKS
jgi:hypothetical protein